MSILASRKVVLWVLSGLLLLTVPFLTAGPFFAAPPLSPATVAASPAVLPPALPPPPAALLTSQILESHTASITTYKVAATPVQGVQPRPDQRGVGLDGALRAAPSFPMHLAGNPFGSPWSANQSLGGVSLANGAYSQTDVDIALPSEGIVWRIGRTYNPRQENSGTHGNSNGYQGKNWFQSSQPELVRYFEVNDSTRDEDDLLYLVYGADRYIEFKRDGDNTDEFKARNGAAGGIYFEADGSNADTYTYTDQWGFKFVFFGYDSASDPAKGQLWKITDPDGNVAFVGHQTDKTIAIVGQGSPAIPAGYDTAGRLKTAYDPAGRRYTYTTSTLDSVVRLTEVKAETKASGSWFDATYSGLVTVAEVDYAYCSTGESHGEPGDLKLVTITTPLTDSSSMRRKYFRYWTGNYTSGSGERHQIKMVLDFEGLRNYDWTSDSDIDATPSDACSASDATLEPYAAVRMEYDSSHRVSEAYFNGACGCGGGSGTGTHTFEYETNTSGSFTAGYDTDWKTRTTIDRPDTSWLVQYFDEVGQSLHEVFTDANPDNTGPEPGQWVTKITRNSAGCVTDLSTPANVTDYTHAIASFAITTSTSVGLVRTFSLATSGDMTGFLLDVKFKTGTSGSAYYESSRTYTSASKLIKTSGNVSVVRPLVATTREFPVATTSPTSGQYNETSFSYTMYTSEIVVQDMTETLPAVSTGNKGSGTAATRREHYTKWGARDWVEHEDDVLEYWHYTNGQVVDHIRDADTSNGYFDGTHPVPSGWVSAGTELHRMDSHTYDAQGRVDQSTPSAGPVGKVSHMRLKDERLVTLRYSHYTAGPNFFGPISCTVMNHAGLVEVSATLKLTADSVNTALSAQVDELDADPITAIDIGTIAQMTTRLYNESGTMLETERLYFSIPASGAGTDGTHYDPTTFGYDDLGRRWRVKEASGTIRRTVYDVRGRVSASWIGTNDSGFSGGEASGTDNMVKIEESEFDSGSVGGNSYVTKRTDFIQDNTTGRRDTTYSNDVRGQALLVTNPTAPHAFLKLDNMGRNLATGMFSATTNIVVGTDDPTTETSNRLSLLETAYHERGQVWKTIRHKINASNGATDDNYENYTWYDATGRVIKEDGEELAKTVYDRHGRATHRFTLAKDNDSAYADADDVSGDHVLLEQQTTYESAESDDVLMEATISRHHDDLSTGNTGALDTNADSDSLLYTATNVLGRIQISAHWYDTLNRLWDTVEYGNNDTDADGDMDNFDRDGLSVPTRSDTKLRTTWTYNYDGTLKEVTDPRALVSHTDYDAAGRPTAMVRNYVNGTPSGSPTVPTSVDDNIARTVYADGLRTKYWVDFDGDNDDQDADDQVTLYTYGTTKGTSAGDSKIATGHLLQKIQYPDSSGGTDVVTYAYNAQGQRIWQKDQAGNIVETDLDDSGRETARKVTTLDADFDGAVRRIATTYDSSGRRQTVTQYDAATSGSVVDEAKFTYESWGNVEKYEQDNDSTVGGSGVTDYEVLYEYEKATTDGRNTIRRTKTTLPGLERVTYQYLTTGNRLDGNASRVTRIRDIGPDVFPPAVQFTIVEYKYNGLDEVVATLYDECSVKRERHGTTSGIYSSLDNFNRIENDVWVKDLTTDRAIYDADVVWDRNSNIVRLDDHVHKTKFDAVYTIDSLDRLTDTREGDLNGTSAIVTESRQQEWTLEQTGNWELEKLDLNGDGDWGDANEHQDDRTHNAVNELVDRDTDDNGTPNYTLSYDEAGNLIDDGESYKYEYDAFYRLRRIKVRTTPFALVAEYRYNGLGFRIAEHIDTEPDGDVDSNDPWHHFAHDERWRVVAMLEGSETDPTEQYVHHTAGKDGWGGASYIDELVLRDRDTNNNGSLDERLYYLQNRHFDVVALVDDTGKQVEMVRYSSYGVPFGLPGGDCDSDGDNDAADHSQIQAWIDAPAYDVRGDIDLDGDVDSSDKSTASSSPFSGSIAGHQELSAISLNANGFSGVKIGATQWYEIRKRCLASSLGRWNLRDPKVYSDGLNLYVYVVGAPLRFVDPFGLVPELPMPLAGNCPANNHVQTFADPPYSIVGGCFIEVDGGTTGWYGTKTPCRWMCGAKIMGASGGIKCPPKVGKFLGLFGGHMDYSRLSEPEFSECDLWHGGDDIKWESQSGDNPPDDGSSEPRDIDASVECKGHDVQTFTATSGKVDPVVGRKRTVGITFTFSCPERTPPSPPPDEK